MAHTPDPLHFCVTCGQRVDPPAEELAAEMLATLKGMVAEFDKFSRYGSPIARDANEAMRRARAAILKAEGG